MLSIEPLADRDAIARWQSTDGRWWTRCPARMIGGSGDLPRPQNASLSQIAGKFASLSVVCHRYRLPLRGIIVHLFLLLSGKRDKGNRIRESSRDSPPRPYWFFLWSSRDSLYSETAGFSTSESLKVSEFSEGELTDRAIFARRSVRRDSLTMTVPLRVRGIILIRFSISNLDFQIIM